MAKNKLIKNWKLKIKNCKKEYLALAVFVILVFVFYGNTLLNGFVQDDGGEIERNVHIRSLKKAGEPVPQDVTTFQTSIQIAA